MTTIQFIFLCLVCFGFLAIAGVFFTIMLFFLFTTHKDWLIERGVTEKDADEEIFRLLNTRDPRIDAFINNIR